jgi:hypothetical protein
MAARHRNRRRTAAFTVVAALVVLPAVVGCDAVSKALDCVQTADSIADSVTDLQQAVENAANDPTQTDASLDAIENNLDKTDNADVNKAVDELNKAVANVRTAVKNGDTTPDISPVTAAAGELTKVCTP